jgi:hypothetical protein
VPRFLGGGMSVACLRSLCTESLEQQLARLQLRLFGDPSKPAHLGLLNNLEAGVPPKPSLCSKTTLYQRNPGDIVAMFAVTKKLVAEGFLLLREAAELYADVKDAFLLKLKATFYPSHCNIFIPTKASTRDKVRPSCRSGY